MNQRLLTCEAEMHCSDCYCLHYGSRCLRDDLELHFYRDHLGWDLLRLLPTHGSQLWSLDYESQWLQLD